jgi:cytochrome oxidase Cu insertion factor (SCO1/SenC/PrrC family)|tara:strand:+ start:236 stop:844 length:609 start_codon:yes stop_codon:yes gene_type:complete
MGDENPNKKNKIIIIVIVLVFIAPSILSWYIFNHTDYLESRGTSNYGQIITPPIQLENLSLIDPLDTQRMDTLYGKWSMIYVAELCDDICMQNVYRMRQIHIGMGKHSLRVQKVLFLIDQDLDELSSLLANYKGQQVISTNTIDIDILLEKFRIKNIKDPSRSQRIYISDPLGNLMMSYPPNINPKGILKDLKKLLRTSRIG